MHVHLLEGELFQVHWMLVLNRHQNLFHCIFSARLTATKPPRVIAVVPTESGTEAKSCASKSGVARDHEQTRLKVLHDFA